MDIIKRYIYFDFGSYGCRMWPTLKNRYSTQSRTWVQWLTVISLRTCAYCADMQGHILRKDDPNIEWPPIHENCHCQILPLTAFPAGTATEDGLVGVDYYLFTHSCLPDNYITQNEAKRQGWINWKGNLWGVLPGAVIGGEQYKNRDGRLPNKPGRIWYEADFDYNGGYRNWKRIVFSNDGLMFVTYDHYLTFSEVYWEDNYNDFYD